MNQIGKKADFENWLFDITSQISLCPLSLIVIVHKSTDFFLT